MYEQRMIKGSSRQDKKKLSKLTNPGNLPCVRAWQFVVVKACLSVQFSNPHYSLVGFSDMPLGD
jgi:hypothetical protein